MSVNTDFEKHWMDFTKFLAMDWIDSWDAN